MSRAPLQDLNIQPGLYTLDTDRDEKGRWKDGDKVRFYKNYPEKLGGWAKAVTTTFQGACRRLTDWRTLRSELFVALGTHLRLFVWDTSVFYNITPIASTGTLANNPFTTTLNSTLVSVHHAAHGKAIGDFVNFSGAAAVGGITPAGDYQVTSVTDADNYVITHSAQAMSGATGGGAAVVFSYEIAIGKADTVFGFGWGAKSWNFSTWGTPRPTSNFLTMARIWSLDNWGEDLIACPRGGGIYVWQSHLTTASRATLISQAPATARFIFVTPQNRTVVALGANTGSADDPMLVRWCDTEDYTNWTAAETNAAGRKRLDQGNELYCGLKLKHENLLHSDSFCWSMVYEGPPYTFGFYPLGPNGALISPNAAVVGDDGKAYWMGIKEFYIYDGVVRPMPCDVLNHVMDSINKNQRAKVYGGFNRLFREVWWVYPSGSAQECDRYVTFNIDDKTWAFGTIVRTAYVGDSVLFTAPYAVDASGYIYNHETGVDADGAAMASHLYSADVEIPGAGDKMMSVKELVPDMKRIVGTVGLTVIAKRYPQDTDTQTDATCTITPTTLNVNPRVRGRQSSFQFSTANIGDDFRMGRLRVRVAAHGGK